MLAIEELNELKAEFLLNDYSLIELSELEEDINLIKRNETDPIMIVQIEELLDIIQNRMKSNGHFVESTFVIKH